MAIKCGSCGREFDSKRGLWNHMIDDHNSPAFEGDEAILCKDILTKKANKGDEKAKSLLAKYEE